MTPERRELARARERHLRAERKSQQKAVDPDSQPPTSENNHEIGVKDCIEDMNLLSEIEAFIEDSANENEISGGGSSSSSRTNGGVVHRANGGDVENGEDGGDGVVYGGVGDVKRCASGGNGAADGYPTPRNIEG